MLVVAQLPNDPVQADNPFHVVDSIGLVRVLAQESLDPTSAHRFQILQFQSARFWRLAHQFTVSGTRHSDGAIANLQVFPVV